MHNIFKIFLALIVRSNFGSAQLTLYPSNLLVNVGYFSLLSNQSVDTCTVTEAISEAQAFSLQNSSLCSTASSTTWKVFIESNQIFLSAPLNIPTRLVQILVVCCSVGTSTIFTAASVIYVDVAPSISIDTTQAAAAGVVYPSLGFVNIAPCPCDLSENACDINCCCDVECANIVSTFSCIPGPFGGNFSTDFSEFCGSQQYPLPDWHLFLCIQFLNTPDLGLFYPIDTNIVRDTASFDARLSLNPASFTFTNSRNDPVLNDVPNYSQGDPILTKIGTNHDYLTLTKSSLSGQCIRFSPVEFQSDSIARCDVTVTENLCANGSILDVNSYNLNGGVVIDGGSSDVTPRVIVMCDSTNETYVKARSNRATGESLFRASQPTSNTLQSCSSNAINPGSQVCQNAVVSVTYTITWNGSDVQRVDVAIVLADVPYSEVTGVFPNNILSQSFRVEFRHSSQNSTALSASGNPGYNFGYPLISGNLQGGSIFRNDTLRVWQPSGSGLCTDASMVAPDFGPDVISGCLLRIPLSRFNDCATLRRLVEAQQTLLIGTAEYISRFGNPTLSAVNSDWLQINISSLSTFQEGNSTVGQCSGIPAHTNIKILYAISGRILGFPLREVVGVSVRSEILDNSTCARDATCWPELLLPLTKVFYYHLPLSFAQMDRQYNFVWALFLIFLSTGYFLLRLDWQKISRYLKQQLPL